MNCLNTRNCLIEYIEGRLDVLRQHEIEIHFEECPECREFAHKLGEVFQFFENEKETEFDPFMYTRIQSLIEKTRRNHSAVAMHRMLQPIFVALLVLMIAFTGITLGKSYSYKNTLANDYKTELYYLSDIHVENIESLLLTK
jgi:predicted anti-sigma-YlaC factor YlaD